jgi:hemoglobin-like flavoprotein
MTRKQISLIRSSWKIAGEQPLTLGILFFDHLFSVCPQTRAIFRSPASLQTTRLMKTVGTIINRLDILDESLSEVTQIAEDYALEGLRAMDYPAVASSLLWALEQRLEGSWNGELSNAWISFYGSLSYLVKESVYRIATFQPVKFSYAS